MNGEALSNESVLNEREVIRVVQVAIDYLKKSRNHSGKTKETKG